MNLVMFYLRLDRISEATSAQRGTIPLRVLLTTNATAHAAISLSSTKSLSSSDCGPTKPTARSKQHWASSVSTVTKMIQVSEMKLRTSLHRNCTQWLYHEQDSEQMSLQAMLVRHFVKIVNKNY